MLLRILLLALAASSVPSFAQTPSPAPVSDAPLTAEEIMAHVAANQDHAESERMHYVYVQHARVISRKGKRVMCEEITDSRVTPREKVSKQLLLKLDGRLFSKGHYVPYDKIPTKSGPSNGGTHLKADHDGAEVELDDDTDVDLVENMRDNLTNNKSKDGISAGLFPLTSKAQTEDSFRLLGRGVSNGRDAYHIEFKPKDKSDFGWKGDAWIDSTEFQPISVRTTMARQIPFAVRAMLGTSLPGLGFTVIYARQPSGLWFPVSFGTEFKINVLFFFHREMVSQPRTGISRRPTLRARCTEWTRTEGGGLKRNRSPQGAILKPDTG